MCHIDATPLWEGLEGGGGGGGGGGGESCL